MSEHEKAIEAAAQALLARGEFSIHEGANRTIAQIAAEEAISAYLAARNAEPVGYVEERGIRKLAGNSPTAAYPQKDEWFNIPLFAAPPAPGEAKVDAVREVAVKPLEWDAPDSWNIAKSVVGTYVVRPCLATNYTGQFVMSRGDEEKSSLYPSEDSAKAAAQSDYASRIRSALLPSPSSASEIERLREALKSTLVGGNHLSSQLMLRVGADFSERFPPDTDHDSVLRRLGATVEYDMWCAWATLMNARASLSQEGEKK